MHLSALKTMATFALMVALGTIPASAALDRKKLLQEGEDYVVALHDTYVEAARRVKGSSYPDLPKFFRDRAVEIEQGGELFPAHPSDFPVSNTEMAGRLQWAYEETYDLATSEAADMQPYLVADVQVAYEQWLITMHFNVQDPDREKLARAFDKSLDALTDVRGVASLATHMTVAAAQSIATRVR
ncbi:MAG TPA: hypothetical protein VEH07_03475 [Alphaproteobacteria bacterium]|nr:hypothetical protein [Alphaproteobacteria bacterium]